MISLPIWVAITLYVWSILSLFFIGITLPIELKGIKSKMLVNLDAYKSPTNDKHNNE